MKTVKTHTATIFCGLRAGYDGPEFDIGEVVSFCKEHCTEVGLCVTVTPTTFAYSNGSEQGAIIGLINYPRFPDAAEHINEKAMRLAERLRILCGQNRVSVICGDETHMLGD